MPIGKKHANKTSEFIYLYTSLAMLTPYQ